MNSYGTFIPNNAQTLQPLTDLLKANPKPFTMTPEAESAPTTTETTVIQGDHIRSSPHLKSYPSCSQGEYISSDDSSFSPTDCQ
ncbi:unnamed protein product [Hymenolepis diminuta]|uniref:Ovule protein n=1 Tax=Hymenolepis diminuta TaxID=6216 RepID=A0A0R3SX04_HYMDI|nr:unnamed protein product [Hymenolepis diminuta]